MIHKVLYRLSPIILLLGCFGFSEGEASFEPKPEIHSSVFQHDSRNQAMLIERCEEETESKQNEINSNLSFLFGANHTENDSPFAPYTFQAHDDHSTCKPFFVSSVFPQGPPSLSA